MALGDFDADGNLDVAVSVGARVFLMAGNGNGTFRHSNPRAGGTFGDLSILAPFFSQNGQGSPVGDLAVADLNHDGRADLVAMNGGSTIVDYVATPDPFFEHVDPFHPGPTGFVTRIYGVGDTAHATLADATGDGVPDVVIAESAAGLLGVITNLGDAR